VTRVRRALRSQIVVWLLCQAAMTTAAPVALLLASNGTVDDAECTCAHGEHAICPMHHSKPQDATECLLRGVDHPDTATLASALSLVGLVPVSAPAAAAALDRTTTLAVPAFAIHRSAPPEPPPPRI
jgi:hypothetical protein